MRIFEASIIYMKKRKFPTKLVQFIKMLGPYLFSFLGVACLLGNICSGLR